MSQTSSRVIRISDVKEGEVFQHIKGTGLVLSRTPEDRTSGSTSVFYEHGERVTYIWDQSDPAVAIIGKGRLIEKLEIYR